MENASKALIIAGAILLAILIIGLGVFIYNQSSNAIGNTGMDQLAVQQFNSQFEPYENIQSGSQIKQLLKTVISNNYTHSDDTSMQVTINGKDPKDYNYSFTSYYDLDGSSDMVNVGEGKMYSVSFDRNNKNGIITNIAIHINQVLEL